MFKVCPESKEVTRKIHVFSKKRIRNKNEFSFDNQISLVSYFPLLMNM